VSSPVANFLGVAIGDSVLLELKNRYNQKDTGVFIVDGIVEDTSIFGYYKSFIDITTMNKLRGFADDECSSIGLYFNKANTVETKRRLLQEKLQTKIPLTPLVYTMDDYRSESDKVEGDIITTLLTIPVYISEVTQILQALNLLSYFLYAMMLLIILVSAGVTYRLILHERTKEIGTMRAMGFGESDICGILLIEAMFLATAALVCGFGLSLFVDWIISFVSFSWMPGFDIFLKNGRMQPKFYIGAELINIMAVYLVVLFAAIPPIVKMSRNPLPELLNGSVKE
jgi:ABC-type antimicrobial peptide transport system permease subunit